MNTINEYHDFMLNIYIYYYLFNIDNNHLDHIILLWFDDSISNIQLYYGDIIYQYLYLSAILVYQI